MHPAPEEMYRGPQYRGLQKAPRGRPYCCDVCPKQFETPSKLARHYLTHTGQKPFPCQDCSKTFRQLVHLERHMMTHSLPFQCNTCHRHFKNSETLSKHQQLHHGVPGKGVRVYRRSSAPAHKNFLSLALYCFGCQKTFQSDEKRLLHQCNYRIVTAVQRPQTRRCDFCDKAFPSRSKLERHLLIHTGQKPFTCALCGKAFRQKTHLKIHLVTHSQEKPFQCSLCPKSFKMLEKLRKHQEMHTKLANTRSKERTPRTEPLEVKQEDDDSVSIFVIPFQCSSCGCTFENQELLDNHQCSSCECTLENQELLDNHQCSSCGCIFDNQERLDNHQCSSCGCALENQECLDNHQCSSCGCIFDNQERLDNHQCSSCGCTLENQELLDNHECLIEANAPETVTSTRRPYDRRSVGNTDCHLANEILPHISTPVGRLLKAEESDHVDKAETQQLGVSKNPFQKGKPIVENVRRSEMDMESYFQHQQLGLNFPGLLENQNGETMCSTFHTYAQGQHGEESHSLHQFLQGAQGILLPRHKVTKCDQCNKTFPSVSKLRRHYLIHTGQKPFTCSECGKTFRQTAHLKRHLVTHVQKVPLLRSPDGLENYYSGFCQQPTTSFLLSRHCHNPTVNAEEVDQVMVIVDADVKVESESMDLSSGSQKRGTLKKTRTSVSKERRAKSRERPMQKVRTRGVKKSYKCSVCAKIFLSPSKLERHYLMHAGQKPFECTECGKSFRQDPHLKRHMLTHIRMKK